MRARGKIDKESVRVSNWMLTQNKPVKEKALQSRKVEVQKFEGCWHGDLISGYALILRRQGRQGKWSGYIHLTTGMLNQWTKTGQSFSTIPQTFAFRHTHTHIPTHGPVYLTPTHSPPTLPHLHSYPPTWPPHLHTLPTYPPTHSHTTTRGTKISFNSHRVFFGCAMMRH